MIFLLFGVFSGCVRTRWSEQTSKYDFTFLTVDSEPHPEFITNSLKNGVVLLHYSEDACYIADIMEEFIWDFFDLMQDSDFINSIESGNYNGLVKFEDSNIEYFYINLDNTFDEYEESYDIYDIKDVKGIPMFTIITLGYYQSEIKPYLLTLYGNLGYNDENERSNYLKDILREAINIYNENS